MSTFIEYTAQQNDRFDIIAYKSYGDVNKMNLIIAANPQIGIIEGTIPVGTVVRVPVLEVAPNIVTADLPPWKR
jgi:phage tail protein X